MEKAASNTKKLIEVALEGYTSVIDYLQSIKETDEYIFQFIWCHRGLPVIEYG